MSNDVNQVLVVQVPCHIWGEGSEHLLHLTDKKIDFYHHFCRSFAFQQDHTAQCALKGAMMIHNEMFLIRTFHIIMMTMAPSVLCGLTHTHRERNVT